MRQQHIAGLLLGLNLAVSCFTYSQESATDSKPNILWIVTDDQRADSIASFNQATRGTSNSALGFVSSPNIDALAAEGTLFTHAYTNSPACAPSRGSMMMGLYPHHSGRVGFERTHNKHDLAGLSIPQVLKTGGYQTATIGKQGYRIYQFNGQNTWKSLNFFDVEISHKNDLNENGLTDFYNKYVWRADNKSSRYELFYFGDGSVAEHHSLRYGKEVDEPNPVEQKLDILRSYTRSNPNLILGGVSPQPAGKTLDGHILNTFKNYLANQDKNYKAAFKRNIQGPSSDKPLMVSLGFTFPHTPVLPPKSYRDKFKDKVYRLPKFSKGELDKLPKQLLNLYSQMKTDAFTEEEQQQAIRDYYAFTAYGDALIGESIELFKQYSAAQNRDWFIVLTVGDHGWQLGEQGISAKFSPWNTSNQGVMVVASSNKNVFKPNSVYSDFVEYVDIAPTLYGAGKVKNYQKLTRLDGIDLAVQVQADSPKQYVLGEFNHVVGPRAYLRSKRFAFSMRYRQENTKPGHGYAPGENIKWAYSATPQQLEWALYDLDCDPNERNNVAYQPSYAPLANAFSDKLTNIVIGDGRVEVDWTKTNQYFVSDFALGAHDNELKYLNRLADKLPHCQVR